MSCPREWTNQQALNALRASIRAKRVSKSWVKGFPRYVWHQEGDVWYEARTLNSRPGEYHAHPIEIIGLPVGLR